nr:methyl-accepting chemotaxis protein [uncultured Sphingomonas sp.]
MQRLLQDIGIMKKILAMMLLLGLVGMVSAGVNAWRIRSIDQQYSTLVTTKLPAIPQLIRGLRYATDMVKNGYRVVAYPVGSEAEQLGLAELADDYAQAVDSFSKAAAINPELQSRVREYEGQTRDVHDQVLRAIKLARSGQQASAMAQMVRADAALTAFVKSTVARNSERVAATARESDELSKSVERNMLLSLLVSIVATAVALLMAHRVVRSSIVSPLLELNQQMSVLAGGNHSIRVAHGDRKDEIGTMSRSVAVFRDQAEDRAVLEADKQRAQAEQEKVVSTVGRHLDSLASGDLTATIREEFPPSYAQLKSSFNAALTSLGALIRSVAESTAEIRTGSSEIAQASEDLARRTEGNAASLEETSAAIVQMNGRLKATASAATQTVGRADQAIATVSGGRGVAEEAVQAMGRVSESAKGIDSVIEGLDKIAFQTRVLAMNAAVEAGRAGEAGRGFAVVADLVSALAMRAEEEAKRARDQLTVTQTDIVTAVQAVGQVDAALQNISADVGEVHDLLGQMATDNQAQALAITEINAAIASMDQSTQQNAAMVEETSAAARNLLSEVSGLAEQSARFRYDGAGAAMESARAPASAARMPAKAVVPAAVSAPAHAKASKLPRRGKEGVYQSPVKPLPAAAIEALTRPIEDDWKEF